MILYAGGPDVPLREVNTAKIYYTGSTHPTSSFGEITVLGQEDRFHTDSKGRSMYYYFVVQFADGTKVQSTSTGIRAGHVKNPNQPSIYEVGFPGQGSHKPSIGGKDTKEYTVWFGMLRRCYDLKHHEKYPTYKDCEVDKRWHNFQNFCEDIQHLEGYKEWKHSNKPFEYDLDKDIKCIGNRLYSNLTCAFVLRQCNNDRYNKKQTLTGLTYIATRLSDGYQEEFTNQSEFADKYTLQRPNINHCLHEVAQTHKGWAFKIKKKGEDVT